MSDNHDVVSQIEATTTAVADALFRLDDDGLLGASDLPGWSRLTIVCHLRYGARALSRMTGDALAGRPTAYYPEGREAQRPSTLEPGLGESPADVVASLRDESRALHDRWRGIVDWDVDVVEPDGRHDLGTVPLARLALLRLTEVEVHGTDLDVGLGPWSDAFVQAVLPLRLAWLPTRRSNHRSVPDDVHRSWLLVATDGGPTTLLTVDGPTVTSTPAASTARADVIVEATSHELLALLLGRSDRPGAAEFTRAFPGP